MSAIGSDGCPDCARARTGATHGGYRKGCAGCRARSLARSMFAHEAFRNGAHGLLRDAIARVMPDDDPAGAFAQVLDWWRLFNRGQEPEPERRMR